MKILYRFIDVVILFIFELRINEYYQFISLNEFKYTCMVCEKVDFVLLCTTLSVLYIYSTILLFFLNSSTLSKASWVIFSSALYYEKQSRWPSVMYTIDILLWVINRKACNYSPTFVQLHNIGPSAINTAIMEVGWPTHYRGEYLLYILQMQTVGPLHCHMNATVNPLQLEVWITLPFSINDLYIVIDSIGVKPGKVLSTHCLPKCSGQMNFEKWTFMWFNYSKPWWLWLIDVIFFFLKEHTCYVKLRKNDFASVTAGARKCR